MSEQKKSTKTVPHKLDEESLRRIIKEVIGSELRTVIREELASLAAEPAPIPYGAVEMPEEAAAYASPDDMSVQPAGIVGGAWRVAKRVGKAAWGVGTLPATALYSAATRDGSAVGHSLHHATDGIAGEGTWNQMRGAYQNRVQARSQNAYVNGVFAGWDKWCGRCGTYFGRYPTPVSAGYCPCGAYNVG